MLCLFRYGEVESRWVAMESWTFNTVISAAEVTSLLKQQQVLLQLDGVDTYADVLLNGKQVAQTTNFHRCAAGRGSWAGNGQRMRQPGVAVIKLDGVDT
jgi:hypothetical protein